MDVRLFCVILMVLCGSLTGAEFSRRLRIRIIALESVRDYLKRVRALISHFGMSLDDVAFELGKDKHSDKFSLKMSDYSQHNSFNNAFSRSLEELSREFFLPENEVGSIASSVSKVGAFDLDGVLSCIDLAVSRIDELMLIYEKKRAADGKLYITLSVCASVVAGLIIL